MNDQFVEGEKVATRMTTHAKARATGEPITLVGIKIARIVDGKIVEEWNTWEQRQPTRTPGARWAPTPPRDPAATVGPRNRPTDTLGDARKP